MVPSEPRNETEIRADVAIMDEAEKWSDRYHDAMVRVLRDVEPLLARAVAAEAENKHLVDWINAYKAEQSDPELLRAQLGAAEAREAQLQGENERLNAEASDNCTGCERPTNSLDTFCWVCKLDDLEQERDSLRAGVAAVEAQLAKILRAARVACRGPNDTDESGMTAAADRLQGGYKIGGSNTRDAVVRVLREVAALAAAVLPEAPKEPQP